MAFCCLVPMGLISMANFLDFSILILGSCAFTDCLIYMGLWNPKPAYLLGHIWEALALLCRAGGLSAQIKPSAQKPGASTPNKHTSVATKQPERIPQPSKPAQQTPVAAKQPERVIVTSKPAQQTSVVAKQPERKPAAPKYTLVAPEPPALTLSDVERIAVLEMRREDVMQRIKNMRIILTRCYNAIGDAEKDWKAAYDELMSNRDPDLLEACNAKRQRTWVVLEHAQDQEMVLARRMDEMKKEKAGIEMDLDGLR